MASATLTPFADTYIDDANPGTNYGSSTLLYSHWDTAPEPDTEKRAMWEFDVDAGIALVDGGTITAITLYTYGSTSNSTSDNYRFKRSDAFDSSTVTWATRPGSLTSTGDISGFPTSTGWKSTDIKSLWDAQGSGILHMYMEAYTDGRTYTCHSIENTWGAYIDITYTPADNYFVKHQSGASNGNAGTSWDTAWRDFGYGLQNAPDGTILHVASNTGTEYTETGPISSGTSKKIYMVVEDVNTTTRGKCQIKVT